MREVESVGRRCWRGQGHSCPTKASIYVDAGGLFGTIGSLLKRSGQGVLFFMSLNNEYCLLSV